MRVKYKINEFQWAWTKNGRFAHFKSIPSVADYPSLAVLCIKRCRRGGTIEVYSTAVIESMKKYLNQVHRRFGLWGVGDLKIEGRAQNLLRA